MLTYTYIQKQPYSLLDFANRNRTQTHLWCI